MAASQDTTGITFAGTAKQQEQAALLFNLFRARGMFMADDAAIRIPLDDLVTFFQQQDGTSATELQAVIDENAASFAMETIETVKYLPAEPAATEAASGEGEELSAEAADEDQAASEPLAPIEVVSETVYVVTTRSGKVPLNNTPVNNHTFETRLMTPEPEVVRIAEPVRERPRVDPSWATYTIPDDFDLEGDEEYGDLADTELAESAGIEPVEAVAPELTGDAVEPVVESAPEPVVEEEPVAAVEEAAVPAEEEAVAEAPAAAAPVAGGILDVSGYSDEAIAAAIESQLGADVRAAVFGSQWMAEERVARLSRGDLRRIKDYIEEQEQPLPDTTLVQDILNVRPNAVDFPAVQFAVNYRLSREHRDFEFVGTNDQRFWNVSSAPPLGTTRRKPNEIGTDYRYLVEEVPDATPRSVDAIDHVLTFYEFTLGLLPFDQDLQRLLPAPLHPDQKAAVLTFEFPQAYATYLVELRYPTPNRGGFLLGLDDFYADNLVPGAMISISATENDGHYKVEFLPGEDQTARLLELDDRRSPRYLFRPTTFSCAVDDAWSISEDRFPRFASEKPLDDRIRRRPDAVVEATFERIGIQDGESWIATFDDLMAAVNVERPFSEKLLRDILEQTPEITSDGSDTFTYATGA